MGAMGEQPHRALLSRLAAPGGETLPLAAACHSFSRFFPVGLSGLDNRDLKNPIRFFKNRLQFKCLPPKVNRRGLRVVPVCIARRIRWSMCHDDF